MSRRRFAKSYVLHARSPLVPSALGPVAPPHDLRRVTSGMARKERVGRSSEALASKRRNFFITSAATPRLLPHTIATTPFDNEGG